MKTRRNAGFTLVEVILIIVVVLILLALMLPGTMHRGTRSARIQCSSNQRQIGLAFRMWAHEHTDRFPMQLTTVEGGTKESAFKGFPLTSFSIISNELNSPKPLACPEDKRRKMVRDFAQLTPNNLSYFLGLDASDSNPQTILTGDRNLCINGQSTNGLVQITDWSTASWDATIHNCQGNLGLADGSAHQVTDVLLRKQLRATAVATNRFAIP